MLNSMVQYLSASAKDLDSTWYSGQSSMFGNTREENMRGSRLDLNWNAGTGGWQTYTFALNLSGLLQHSLYLPPQRNQSRVNEELSSRSKVYTTIVKETLCAVTEMST